MPKKTVEYLTIYKNFYSIFQKVVHQNGCHPPLLDFESYKRKDTGLKNVALREPIFLPNWPVVKELPASSVDILINVAFNYYPSERTPLHKSSKVYVTYLVREDHGKTARVIENIRFEYQPGPENDESHPLIHAHIFSSGKPHIDKSSLARYETNWEDIKPRLNSFRLPIPNMTLPSILCSLVACHLGVDKMKDLLSMSKDIRRDFPGLAIEEEQLKILFSNSFAGSQWFLRSSEPSE